MLTAKSLHPEGFTVPPAPVVESVEIPNATAEDLWSRLSADFTMISNYAKANMAEYSSLRNGKRFFFGMLINDDEFYNKVDRIALTDVHVLNSFAYSVHTHRDVIPMHNTNERPTSSI